MSDTKWPTYEVGPQSDLHALGVIAANFNRLEYSLLGIFLLYVGYNDPTAWLFRRLNDNRARLDLIELHLAGGAGERSVSEPVEYFCKCFEACMTNRNILLHSRAVVVTQGDEFHSLSFVKSAKSKTFEWNRYRASLKKLRQIADEIDAFADFGQKLHNHIVAHFRPELEGPAAPLPKREPLPNRPPQPTALTPQ